MPFVFFVESFFTRDPRGTRYEVTGYTEDVRGLVSSVVCLFGVEGEANGKRVQLRVLRVGHGPVWVCAKCGEKYYDAPVVKRLEQIARRRRRISKTVSFPLAEYKMALR